MLLSEYEPSDEALRGFIERIHVESPLTIQRHTVAFFAEQDTKQKQCGSGVLLQIAGRHFVLTAAHVLDIYERYQLPLFLIADQIGGKLIPLDGAQLYSSELPTSQDRFDDPMDIGFVELTASHVARLVSSKEFLHLRDIDLQDQFAPKSWYMIVGYPSIVNITDQSQQCYSSTLFAYGTFPYREGRGRLPNFNADFDVAMEFSIDDSVVGNDEQSVEVPNPKGMSGCGIWRIASADKAIESWTPDDIKLVGIQHTWSRQLNVLRGVKIVHPVLMLSGSVPELVPALRLKFGDWA